MNIKNKVEINKTSMYLKLNNIKDNLALFPEELHKIKDPTKRIS